MNTHYKISCIAILNIDNRANKNIFAKNKYLLIIVSLFIALMINNYRANAETISPGTLSIIISSILLDDENSQILITHYYASILRRHPDSDGLAYWKQLIEQKQTEGLDAKRVFRDMANFFINSPEYLNRNTTNVEFITNLYLTFLQRKPDDGGYTYWLEQLESGMTRNDAMAGFLYSIEFTNFMESFGF